MSGIVTVEAPRLTIIIENVEDSTLPGSIVRYANRIGLEAACNNFWDGLNGMSYKIGILVVFF